MPGWVRGRLGERYRRRVPGATADAGADEGEEDAEGAEGAEADEVDGVEGESSLPLSAPWSGVPGFRGVGVALMAPTMRRSPGRRYGQKGRRSRPSGPGEPLLRRGSGPTQPTSEPPPRSSRITAGTSVMRARREATSRDPGP